MHWLRRQVRMLLRKKLKSLVYHLTLQEHALIAIKPQTFMNLSGEAVVAVMNYYKLTPNEICIVTDDLDIEFGRVRMRLKGGPGNHNGMKSVLQHLGTSQVARLRLGIGPKPEGIDLSAFVLNPFHSNRQLELPLFLSSLVDHFRGALNESMDVMMHRLNSIQIADKNLGSNKS